MKGSNPNRKSAFRLRSRVLSTVLAVLVICALLLTAFAGDRLEERFALQRDYSYNGATTQSQITTNILKRMTKDVHFYVIHSEGNANSTILSLLARSVNLNPSRPGT